MSLHEFQNIDSLHAVHKSSVPFKSNAELDRNLFLLVLFILLFFIFEIIICLIPWNNSYLFSMGTINDFKYQWQENAITFLIDVENVHFETWTESLWASWEWQEPMTTQRPRCESIFNPLVRFVTWCTL